MLELAAQKLGSWRVLYGDGDTLFASRGLELFASQDAGATFAFVGSLAQNPFKRLAIQPTLIARLLRSGFHFLTRRGNGDLIATVRGAIAVLPKGETSFRIVHKIERGTRPLSIATSASGRLFFGEYFGNPNRDPVHIYASDDGHAWSVAYTFPAGSVRHVHGIYPDPDRGGLWVLTGDSGDEAGLWWTEDECATLKPVARGTQSARAMVILNGPDGPIVPTDTPQETNWIQRLDTTTGTLERLAELPGSVFYGTRTPRLFVVSTVIEPSPVNRAGHVALFASSDARHWRAIARFRRDLPLLDDRQGYLQYPTLLLPHGSVDSPFLFASGQSLGGLHGQLLRWSEDEIVAFLARSQSAPSVLAA